MALFKKKKAQEVPTEETSNEETFQFKQEQDFEFVQLDKSIHDVKFKTKPTTYFKDALKRFLKSKSSVTAAAILGVIVLMAIIVPVADGNDIQRENRVLQYLPPKFWDIDAGGFLDGTGYITNAQLDPNTHLPAASVDSGQAQYVEEGIMGEIEESTMITDGSTSSNLAYGANGYVTIRVTTNGGTAHYLSPYINLDLTAENVIEFNMQSAYTEDPSKGGTPQVGVFFYISEEGSYVPTYELVPLTTDLEDNYTLDVTSLINEQINDPSVTAVQGCFGFEVIAPEGRLATTYVEDFQYSVNGTVNTSVSWSDSTAFLAGREGTAWTRQGSCQNSLEDTELLVGSFRYDYYAAAFRDDTFTFSEQLINSYIAKGYMTYTWNHKAGTVGEFALTELGKEYCPIREVTGEVHERFQDIESWSLTGVRSRYRYMYDEGYISTNSPNICFLFGTTEYGQDFFKILFSGLLFSLGLGVLTSIINITIGIVWGAISGYFGGWVDLLMERMTEILGGMPFIVLMTLIVLLLGSSFWTLLLALCLTGWIGMSATTRSQFYRFKGREYVLASRTLGASDARLIFRHILPNGVGMMVTSGVLMIPSVIFSEATISYLLPGVINFGSSQSFGVTLSTAQAYINTYPYMIISGSVIMAIIMICFNLFGNGLRDAFNPSMKGAQD